MSVQPLDQATLKYWLKYYPKSGNFRWRVKPNRRILVNSIAGYLTKQGYMVIKLDGRNLLKASRLAWLYVTGEFPEQDIDHKDRNPENNKWRNLRPATREQNVFNRGIPKHNNSGILGVAFVERVGRKSKWHARIRVKRKGIYLGAFDRMEDAVAARLAAEKKYFKSFRPSKVRKLK